MNELSRKQKQFVAEYIIDLNGTKAAIRAGYSPRTADMQASRMLTKAKIQEALKEAIDDRAARTQITADEVVRSLANIARFDPRKLFHEDGSPKDITELDDETAAAISGLDVSEFWIEDEEGGRRTGTVKKWRAWDKNSALAALMKHFGLGTERVDVTTNGQPLIPTIIVLPSNGRDTQ